MHSFQLFALGDNYVNCEKAWQEQREFIWMAIDQLSNVQPLYQMIQQALSQLLPQEPNLSGQLLKLLPLKKQ